MSIPEDRVDRFRAEFGQLDQKWLSQHQTGWQVYDGRVPILLAGSAVVANEAAGALNRLLG